MPVTSAHRLGSRCSNDKECQGLPLKPLNHKPQTPKTLNPKPQTPKP